MDTLMDEMPLLLRKKMFVSQGKFRTFSLSVFLDPEVMM